MALCGVAPVAGLVRNPRNGRLLAPAGGWGRAGGWGGRGAGLVGAAQWEGFLARLRWPRRACGYGGLCWLMCWQRAVAQAHGADAANPGLAAQELVNSSHAYLQSPNSLNLFAT